MILVGEAPTEETRRSRSLWLHPRYSDSARRLLDYSGLSEEAFLDLFPFRTNVLTTSSIERGSRERESASRRVREAVVPLARESGMNLVILGRFAASTLDWYEEGDWDLYQVRPRELKWYVVSPRRSVVSVGDVSVWAAYVPHPSGRCRWWNDEKNRRSARHFFERMTTHDEERS